MSPPAPAGTDADLAAALHGSRVVLAYGLLGEVMARLRPLGIDYLGTQADWLRDLGLEVVVAPLPTAAPVAANAASLVALLVADPRPAVLLAHSKGGLECLAALLRPEAAARCRGLIALQSPFLGTELADAICRRRTLHRALHHLARLLHLGDGEGLTDLTTTTRATWMRQHAEAVAALPHRLPVVTAATTLATGVTWRDRLRSPLAHWLESRGAGLNDGMVPLRSATLAGAPPYVLPGDHRALVARGPGRDPVGVLRGLLWRMLAREAELLRNQCPEETT